VTVDRGLAGYRRTQNVLARALCKVRLEPKRGRHPDFDLGWWEGNTFCVAEIKSLTDVNEERQLRLAVVRCSVMRTSFVVRSLRSAQ
jgi:hypothetical protein